MSLFSAGSLPPNMLVIRNSSDGAGGGGLERREEVAVGNDAHQFPVRIDDGRGAGPARSGENRLIARTERGRLRDGGAMWAGPHDPAGLHQEPSEGPARMAAGGLLWAG